MIVVLFEMGRMGGGGGVVKYFQIAIAESLSVFDYLQLKIN